MAQDATKMTPEQLEQAGRLLHGRNWQTPLAEDLGMDSRRIREYMSGARSIPYGIWDEIIPMLLQRATDSNDFAASLTAAYATAKALKESAK